MSDGEFIAVTGADGFAGRALCAHLRQRRVRVRGLVRSLKDAAHARNDDTFVTGDLAASDERVLATAIRGARVVVHLAGRAHITGDAPDAEQAYQLANCAGTQRLARAAAVAGVTQLVFASTVKVNGEATWPGRPFVEGDAALPHDAYARSKWAAEQALAEIARETGLGVTVLRLPLMYGPGAKGNFARLVNAVARGVPLPLGAVTNRRSLLSVANFVTAVDTLRASNTAAARQGVATYFLADAEAPSTPALIRAIANALHVPARLVPVPVPLLRLAGACFLQTATIARLTGSLEVDTAAFRRATGWHPPFTLAEGLRGVAASAETVTGRQRLSRGKP